MARKPVLTGGKRDEIIKTATALFFEKGYEATSVRMIMEIVNGEIGMFYHYFKSKEELFDRVVEKFFDDYRHVAPIMVLRYINAELFLACVKKMAQLGKCIKYAHEIESALLHLSKLHQIIKVYLNFES